MSPLHRSAIPCLLAAACSAAFAGPLDNAWLKGTTDKDPLSYAPGEEIVFTVEPMGVEGDVPEGEYTLEWTRSDDFGARETGRIPFAPTSFVYRTSLDRPGFVRLEAYVLGPDGKRYAKKFTGDASTPEGKKAMARMTRKEGRATATSAVATPAIPAARSPT